MSASKEIILKIPKYKKDGFICLRETWINGEIKHKGKQKDGLTILDIEWPANDEKCLDMRFPSVKYKFDSSMESKLRG